MPDGLTQKIKRFFYLDDELGENEDDSVGAKVAGPKQKSSNIVRLDFRREPVIKHHRPKTFEDAELAADLLKSGAPVIITLELVEGADKIRMIDFLLGVAYALDGYVRKITNGVYMFSPAGIPIQGTEPETRAQPRFELMDATDGDS